MKFAELQFLVDVLAERIGRSVVLDDPDITVLVASRHYGDADRARVQAILQRDVGGPRTSFLLEQGIATWTEPGYLPPVPALGVNKTRVCHPVRFDGHLLGFLIVIDDDRSMTSADMSELLHTGRQAAALLWPGYSEGQSRRDMAERAVASLVDGDEVVRSEARAVLEVEGIIQPEPHLTVTLVRVTGSGSALEDRVLARQATTVVERLRPRHALSADLADDRVLVQTWRTSPDLAQLRAQVAEVRETMTPHEGVQVLIAVSKTWRGPAEAWKAYRDADVALRASTRVPRLGGTAFAAELGPLELLLRIPPSEVTDDLLPSALVTLRAADNNGVLTETLRCFLDHGGSARATAEALHIHRTSLYYRLERIEQLMALSLQDGRVRLTLHLGLELLDLLNRTEGLPTI
jgi:hypothetical protein